MTPSQSASNAWYLPSGTVSGDEYVSERKGGVGEDDQSTAAQTEGRETIQGTLQGEPDSSERSHTFV